MPLLSTKRHLPTSCWTVATLGMGQWSCGASRTEWGVGSVAYCFFFLSGGSILSQKSLLPWDQSCQLLSLVPMEDGRWKAGSRNWMGVLVYSSAHEGSVTNYNSQRNALHFWCIWSAEITGSYRNEICNQKCKRCRRKSQLWQESVTFRVIGNKQLPI